MADRGLRVLDTYGRTQLSLDLWKLTRCMFGEFVEAKCGNYSFRDGPRYSPDLWMSPVIAEDFSGLILVDVDEGELWMNGCKSGYGGLGPQGTREILQAEGFSQAHLEVVRNFGQFHIRKDREEPLQVAERRQ